MFEGHENKKLVDARKRGVLCEAFEASVKLHVFKHGQLLIESVFLGHNAEALLDATWLDRGIVTKDFEVSTATQDNAVQAAYER
jgi:hypothetical protein